MRYISTRGDAPILEFDEVLLAGLAEDGGLYVPETWPQLTADGLCDLRGLSYAEMLGKIVDAAQDRAARER